MTQHLKIPIETQHLLEWFGKIISQPLNKQTSLEKISIANDVATFVSPGLKLMPHQCVEIYNKQFWLRLLNILQKNFPFVSYILGLKFFHKISTEYLQINFPNHWSITFIGEKFQEWLKNYSFGENTKLVYHAAEIDWIFYTCYISKRERNLNLDSFTEFFKENQFETKLCLQPCVRLVMCPCDLPCFREKIIKKDITKPLDLNYIIEDSASFYVIFRNFSGKIAWKNLTEIEFLMLTQFKNGLSLNDICTWIHKQDENKQNLILENFLKWIQSWVSLGWIFLM